MGDLMPFLKRLLGRGLDRQHRIGSRAHLSEVTRRDTPKAAPPGTMTHAQPTVSIILPCRNEARHIRPCLDSVLHTTYPRGRIELLIADGMSDDGTRAVLMEYAAAHRQITVIDNPARNTPSGLNATLRIATGEIIVRMDAHTVYPPEYITRLVAALEETGADNVGGRVITVPDGEGAKALAIAIGLSHPLGVGNSHFRVGASRWRWVDHVPFGCWRRALFQQIGLFDEQLPRDQDVELNGRIIKRGGRILLLPEVTTTYYGRRTLGQLARMLYQYGYFKPLVARKLGRVLTLRQLVPPLFLLALVGTGGLSLWWSAGRLLFGTILVTYALLVVGASAQAARRDGLRCGVALLGVFPVMHVCYGFGYLRGICAHLLHLRADSRPAGALALTR
jgi:GT2 family glycosyltransferase